MLYTKHIFLMSMLSIKYYWSFNNLKTFRRNWIGTLGLGNKNSIKLNPAMKYGLKIPSIQKGMYNVCIETFIIYDLRPKYT